MTELRSLSSFFEVDGCSSATGHVQRSIRANGRFRGRPATSATRTPWFLKGQARVIVRSGSQKANERFDSDNEDHEDQSHLRESSSASGSFPPISDVKTMLTRVPRLERLPAATGGIIHLL